MSLIWFLSGSPLSGGNLCSMVTEDGKTETVRVPFSESYGRNLQIYWQTIMTRKNVIKPIRCLKP